MKSKDYISPIVECRSVQYQNMLAISGVPAVTENEADEFGEVFSNQDQFGELW